MDGMISRCGSADVSSPGAAANFSGLGEHGQVLRETSVNKTCRAFAVSNYLKHVYFTVVILPQSYDKN